MIQTQNLSEIQICCKYVSNAKFHSVLRTFFWWMVPFISSFGRAHWILALRSQLVHTHNRTLSVLALRLVCVSVLCLDAFTRNHEWKQLLSQGLRWKALNISPAASVTAGDMKPTITNCSIVLFCGAASRWNDRAFSIHDITLQSEHLILWRWFTPAACYIILMHRKLGPKSPLTHLVSNTYIMNQILCHEEGMCMEMDCG